MLNIKIYQDKTFFFFSEPCSLMTKAIMILYIYLQKKFMVMRRYFLFIYGLLSICWKDSHVVSRNLHQSLEFRVVLILKWLHPSSDSHSWLCFVTHNLELDVMDSHLSHGHLQESEQCILEFKFGFHFSLETVTLTTLHSYCTL